MNWNWKGILQMANQYGMDGYRPGTPQAPQGYVPYEATLNQRGLSNNMQPDNSVIPGTTYQPDNFGNRQPQAVAQMEAELQAQQAQQQREVAKQIRIKEIEAEIAEIEQRMADRKKSMKRNEDISSARIAALEARKFFSQDPTSIWRWKQGMDAQKAQRAEDMARLEAEKQKNKAEQKLHVQNKLNSYLPTMAISLSTSPEQAQQYLNTLAGLETEANNYGIDDPRIAEMKARLSGDLPYNQMMAAIDELEDIDANFGKGPDYDRLNDAQKFEVYQKKLEDAKNAIIANYPELWQMMDRDRRYSKKLAALLANRRPKSKGTAPARPSTRK